MWTGGIWRGTTTEPQPPRPGMRITRLTTHGVETTYLCAGGCGQVTARKWCPEHERDDAATPGNGARRAGNRR